MSASLLIVEDERSSREYLRLLLEEEGHQTTLAANGVEAMVALERDAFDLLISDLHMPEMDGLELLSHVKQRWPRLPVIVITAASEASEIVEAVQLGATNYLVKPAPPAAVTAAIEKALRVLPRTPQAPSSISELVGKSRQIVEVRHQVSLAAQSDVPVLITGQTGTGKELVARAVHRYSNVAGGPFVPHNCAVSPQDLFESEFFGHRRGSFTGADRDHNGLLVQADGGVLFLDELEALALPHQAKLLRVLDDGEVRPVGSDQPVQVNVRFVAATNLDPRAMLAEGSLREDLYYRLRGFEIALPPLAARREDIPLLVESFLGDAAAGFLPDAIDALVTAPWPGNIRQLRNVVRGAHAVARDAPIGVRHLSLDSLDGPAAQGAAGTAQVPRGATLKDIEQRAILQALEDCNGNRTRAARLLDIDRSTLRRKLREYGIAEEKKEEK
jgi:two-component system NtrC family response regulator